MSEKKEMSQLQRQLLGGGGAITLFTQQEFDEAMDVEQGKIMMIAMQAAKKAVELEREECAKLAQKMADDEEIPRKFDNDFNDDDLFASAIEVHLYCLLSMD